MTFFNSTSICRMLVLALLLPSPSSMVATALATSKNRSYKTFLKIDHMTLRKIATSDNSIVFIDVENVRGKSGFELDHDTLLHNTHIWMQQHSLSGKVTCIVDHGSVECGYFAPQHDDMAILFAGPHQKADDVIAKDVQYFANVLVVTSDVELQRRCRHNANDELHIMNPLKFLDDVEQTMRQHRARQMMEDEDNDADESVEPKKESLDLKEAIELGQMDVEIKLGGQLLEAESMIRSKKNMTKKRRKKLEQRARNLRERLATRGPSVLDRVTSILNDDDDANEAEQKMLLDKWKHIRKMASRREETGDRVILAERLRRDLEDNADIPPRNELLPGNDTCVAMTHVNIANGLVMSSVLADRSKMPARLPPKRAFVGSKDTKRDAVRAMERPSVTEDATIDDSSSASSTSSTTVWCGDEQRQKQPTLSMVVISDTHGYEYQFAQRSSSSDGMLPDADVLLHLGDFAIDGTTSRVKEAVDRFDIWLAQQPHKHKIVVRGNHDPIRFTFKHSNVTYVTRTQTIEIGGYRLACVPYGSSRMMKSAGGLPSDCDVLASHVPPKNHMDRCLNGQNVGSPFLLQQVRKLQDQRKPNLWLCGHIHEGRGMMKRRFGKTKETTIINAANANHGRAETLRYGPVVVELNNRTDDIEVLLMDDAKQSARLPSAPVAYATLDSYDPQNPDEDESASRSLLLAVDLGLKTGVSLFNDEGQLIRYQQFQFGDREELETLASDLLIDWEDTANDAAEDDDVWKIRHVAIEGADVALRESWRRVIADDDEIVLLSVPPEEWRYHLLTRKERKSGADAKAASRLIARQVVQDYGMQQHVGKFPTDVAESVVMGLYVSRRLGWIEREPAIRRFMNGRVVVPK